MLLFIFIAFYCQIVNCEWKTHRLKFPLTLPPVADGHFESNESVSGAGFVKLVLFICMDKNKENSFEHGSVDLWLWWWCVLNITRAPFATDCSRANPYIYYWQHIDICFTWNIVKKWPNVQIIIPPPNEVGVGVYWIHLVRPSVCPSVCRRYGFRSRSLLCNFNFKFHKHIDGGHRQKPIYFQRHHFKNGRLAAILDFWVSRL